jgi:hypothetical protein
MNDDVLEAAKDAIYSLFEELPAEFSADELEEAIQSTIGEEADLLGFDGADFERFADLVRALVVLQITTEIGGRSVH